MPFLIRIGCPKIVPYGLQRHYRFTNCHTSFHENAQSVMQGSSKIQSYFVPTISLPELFEGGKGGHLLHSMELLVSLCFLPLMIRYAPGDVLPCEKAASLYLLFSFLVLAERHGWPWPEEENYPGTT